jgi:5-methylcytosine-specific restriction endonuclease McrA
MDTLVLNKDGSPLSVLPLSIIPWQTAIRLTCLEKVRVLKEYDEWVVRSPSTTMHVPSIVICTDFVKWNRQIKYNRSNVYLRDNFTCQLQTQYKCKKQNGKWKIQDLTLDHVLPRHKGGKTNWKNIVTACRDCNSAKGHDDTVVPKHLPYVPSYYELVAKRQKLPLYIKDKEWSNYLSWDPELIVYQKGA